MIKNKIMYFLIASLLSFQISLPCFALLDDEEDIKVIIKIQSKINHYKSLAVNLQSNNDILKNEVLNLNKSLKEADELIEYIFQAPPTVHSYLSAVFNKAPDEELNKLFAEATNEQKIRDVIVGGHTKFKDAAPRSHRRLLEITGLVEHMKISEKYATVTYGEVSIPPSPVKDVKEKEKALNKTIARLEDPEVQDTDPNDNNQ